MIDKASVLHTVHPEESETPRWHLRLYERGQELNERLSVVRSMYPLLLPQDPEEARWQQQLKVDRGVYTHLDWLFRMELRTLPDLAAIYWQTLA